MIIRPAGERDEDAIWAIIEPPLRAGETYALPRDGTREALLAFWLAPVHAVFVAEADGAAVGTYFLRTNEGGDASVANCGYVTAGHMAGRGVARAMCAHSLDEAAKRGYKGMQFNCVVSTNERAVRLWQSCGFEIVERRRAAFHHPRLGAVDAYVMYRGL